MIKFLIIIYKPLKEISGVGSHNIVICSEHLSVVKCHIHGKSLRPIEVRLIRIGLEFFMMYAELLAYVVLHYTYIIVFSQ